MKKKFLMSVLAGTGLAMVARLFLKRRAKKEEA